MIKRAFDLSVAVVGLVLLFPLLLIVSIIIMADGTGGGVFADAPRRVGLKGKEFRMFKFRTMVPHAHSRFKKENELAHKQQKHGKIRTDEDPRVTPIGRILRKTDIDEIPQLINVILGEMSVVGPRPYYREEIDRYCSQVNGAKNTFNKILSVRPGMTGLWQVSGRNDIFFEGRVELDKKYVDEYSFTNDLMILVKTPWVVLSRKGAW